MLTPAFGIGASGLRAMQYAADLHSNNIANADTPGYRRRDAAFSTQQFGGVQASTIHRFDTATAARIAQAAGQVSFADTRAGVLDEAEQSFSLAATSTGAALNTFRTTLAQLQLTPSDTAVRQTAAAQAGALAATANQSLQMLDGQLSQLQQQTAPVRKAAEQMVSELRDLNEAVQRDGASPAIRDRQAQVGKELSQLVGGQLVFAPNGHANYMVDNAFVVQGSTLSALPAQVSEGRLGGLSAVTAELQSDRDALSQSIGEYSTALNAANQSNGGGALYQFDGHQLRFSGDDSTFAVGAQPLSELKGFGVQAAQIASDVATRAAAAKSVYSTTELALNTAEAARQAQEGVDLDQEAIALKTAQRLYEANAKVIQTADAMLGTLLSIKA